MKMEVAWYYLKPQLTIIPPVNVRMKQLYLNNNVISFSLLSCVPQKIHVDLKWQCFKVY